MDKLELLALIKDSLAPHLAEAVAALAMPVLIFADFPQSTKTLTFFGGEPVMSAVQDWPYAEAATLPDGAETFGGDVVAHIANDLPLSFVAQFDLATAPATTLPSAGRLLFFYDSIAGPYESGPRFARVLWDKGQNPVPHPTPQALLDAQTAYITATKEALANFQMPEISAQARELMKQAGLSDAEIENIANTPPPDLSAEPVTSPFRGPRASKTWFSGAMLPSALLHEFQTGAPDLHELYFGTTEAAYAFQEAYDSLTFESTYTHMLGTPLPEQDDPRYGAAVLQLLGRQFVGDDWSKEKANILAEAQNWQLLLEITLTEWLQDGNYEGTVYFLIREDDLKNRRFERAIAVYQQT